MPIPSRAELLFPILDVLGDGGERTHAQLVETLADSLRLTAAERGERLSNGHIRFHHLVSWAVNDLKAAGLLWRIAPGKVLITPVGETVLQSGVTELDAQFLAPFYQQQRAAETNPLPPPLPLNGTPEQTMELLTHKLHSALAESLLERIKAAPPAFFERLVIDLLLAMGYGGSRANAGRAIGRSGDEGIDGVIEEDKLGLDVIYVQAKRWEGVVGRAALQAFAGSLDGQRAKRGVFITTSSFTREAVEYVSRIEKRIILIDGARLAALMIESNVGVVDKAVYTVKDMDENYFADSS
jgi:restriction system protein